MTLVLKTYNEDAMTCSGTVQLQGGAVGAFQARVQEDLFGNESGVGQVQTANGLRPIRSRETDEGLVVEYEGRVYQLKIVALNAPPPAPPPPPAPAPRPAPVPGGGAKGGPKSGALSILTKREKRADAPRIVLTKHTMKDPGTNNIESHSVLAPKDWKVEGGAWWSKQIYFNILPSRDIKITAPDGRRVHLAPSLAAKDFVPSPQLNQPRPKEFAADMGIPIVYMPTSLEAWKHWMATWVLPRTYPGLTDLRVEATIVPELTTILKRNIEPTCNLHMQNNQFDASLGMRSFCDGAVLAFECNYTHEGRSWEELVMFGTSHMGFDSMTGRQIWWGIDPSISYRAPTGKLEESLPLLKALGDSMRVTPQWMQKRAELQAQLNKIALKVARDANKAAMERSRIISQNNREINDIIVKGYEKRQAIKDRTHERVINTIRGTEDYVVPGTSEYVQLPAYYENVYTNSNGEYLLSNDHLYDPNTDPAVNSSQWNTMEVRP